MDRITITNKLPKRLQSEVKLDPGKDVAVDVEFPRQWYSQEELQKIDDVERLRELLADQESSKRLKKVVFELQVPKTYDVNLRTAGGSVDLADLDGSATLRTAGGHISIGSVSGPVDAHTAGGSITARNIENRAEVRTAGGRIELGTIRGDLQAATAGGSIVLGTVDGSATARTSGGSIRVEQIEGSLQAHTSGGHIKVAFGRSPRGDSVLRTSGGSITVGLDRQSALDIEARSHGRIKGPFVDGKPSQFRKSLNGGGPKLTIHNGNSSVKFQYVDSADR